MAPLKKTKRDVANPICNKNDTYKLKRIQNNEAVRKSRSNAKQRTQETINRKKKLNAENIILEEKVNSLTKELQFLKELFLAHASNTQNPKFEGLDLQKLFEDVPND